MSSVPRFRVKGGSGSSGLYAYQSEDGLFAVSVCVYPKAWPPTLFEGFRSTYRSRGAYGREAITLLLQEGKEVAFAVGEVAVPAVQAMMNHLQRRRTDWRREQKAKIQARSGERVDSEINDEEETSDLELAVEAATSLPVECSLSFSREGTIPDDVLYASPETAAVALTAALRDLAWLCLRAGELRSAATDGGGEETAGHLLDAARAADEVDPLALLAELDFVHELHRLQHRIRKGYVPEEDRLAAIRGRITDRGVLDYATTGIPLLECRFDEFVEATPLFRVLVTALDVVSAGSLRSTLGVETDGLFGSMSEVHPRTMREQLRSIPSLPLPVARATADRLRLTRLQQEWQRPLDLAKRILRAESVETGYATQEGSMTVWTVDTAKVWESILEQAFEAAGNGTSVSRPTMKPPWIELGNPRQVDLTVTCGEKTYLVDAKYKLGTPGSSTADQYQLFAYSLLHGVNYSKDKELLPINDEDRPDAVALVYPVPIKNGDVPNDADDWSKRVKSAHAKSPFTREFLNTPGEHPKVVLHLLQAPFASPEVVRDERQWKVYLAGVGRGLQHRIESPTPR